MAKCFSGLYLEQNKRNYILKKCLAINFIKKIINYNCEKVQIKEY